MDIDDDHGKERAQSQPGRGQSTDKEREIVRIGKGGFEIPFLICMGLSFGFTVILMILVSLFAPKVSAKSFDLKTISFKLEPATVGLIVVTVLLLTALYVKFW